MTITNLSSTDQTLGELGRRVRAVRIDVPLTQAELSERAGVSLRTLSNLERGRDVTLSSLIAVLRALSLLTNADALVPETSVRPTDLARLGRERKRATSPAHRKRPDGAWKWGDER